MATKVKPCRLNVTGTPQVGDVPVYYDEDTFEWGAGGGGGGNVKSFTLSSTSDLTTAQEAYDWYDDGNMAIIIYNDKEYIFDYATAGNAYWSVANEEAYDTASATGIQRAALQLALSSGSVTAITTLNISVNDLKVLRTDKNYGTPYSPQYDGSPATKKYVDDNKGDTIVYATQAEYNALLPGAESDGKHYFIYSTSGGGGWQPGANTLAYRPLTEDANDQLGNYNGTIAGDALTFGTAGGSTIDSAFFAGTRMTTSLTGAWKTLNLWVYKPSTSNDPNANNRKQIAGNMNSSGNSGGMVRAGNANSSSGQFYINLGGGDISYSYGTITNQWINLCLITNGSNSTKLYINGVEQISTSSTWDTSYTFWLGTAPRDNLTGGNCWWGNISNVIIESVERSAQEISDYYDASKGQYGIS